MMHKFLGPRLRVQQICCLGPQSQVWRPHAGIPRVSYRLGNFLSGNENIAGIHAKSAKVAPVLTSVVVW